jgi:enolase-phosphatase E1
VTPRVILTDIEGTTSSIAFVHDVLFPYARERIAAFVAAASVTTDDILDKVRAQVGDPSLGRAACLDQLLAWHDADAKVGPLKTLQGLIWSEGYARGELKGHVYADAADGLRRWRARGFALYVYSSGSVAAQKLLFGQSDFGDLLPLFDGHFDTAIGGKKDTAAYTAIARAIGEEPADILFLSDVEAELAAAQAAGLGVLLLARDESPGACAYKVATSFDEILP